MTEPRISRQARRLSAGLIALAGVVGVAALLGLSVSNAAASGPQAVEFPDGSRWVRYESPVTQTLRAVAMPGPDQGWAVGEDGVILELSGGRWTRLDSPFTTTLRSIAVGPGGSVAVADRSGVYLSANPSLAEEWAANAAPPGAQVGAVAIGTDGSVFVGGSYSDEPAVWQVEEGALRQQWLRADRGAFLWDIAVDTEQHWWAVGSNPSDSFAHDGYFIHETKCDQAGPPDLPVHCSTHIESAQGISRHPLRAISVVPDRVAWVVGKFGMYGRQEETSGFVFHEGSNPTLLDVDGVNPSLAWAVGREGVLAQLKDREMVVRRSVATDATLRGVAVVGDVGWAVGDAGLMFRLGPVQAATRVFLPALYADSHLPGTTIDAAPATTTGGLVGSVAYADDLALAVRGLDLAVLDLSDPMRPDQIGHVRLHASPADIELVGERAYLIRGGEIWIVDVTDPTRPVERAIPDPWRACAEDDPPCERPRGLGEIEARDGHAYLTDWDGTGLHILDLASPDAPVEVARTCPMNAYRLALGETHAYVLAGRVLCIADVSNPSDPVMEPLVQEEWRFDIAILGEALFLLNKDNPQTPEFDTVTVLNVSDPMRPIPVTSLPIEEPLSISTDANRAYVAGNTGVHVISVPANTGPQINAHFPRPDSVTSVEPAGEAALMVEPAAGLTVLEVTQGDQLRETATLFQDAFAAGHLALESGRLHVVGRNGGIRVLDLARDHGPRVTATYGSTTPVPGARLNIHEGLAFVSAFDRGLQIYDVSSDSPRQLTTVLAQRGTELNPPTVVDTQVIEQAVFVAAGAAGLYVLDISKPEDPAVLNRLTSVDAQGIAVGPNHLYVSGSDGLHVLDRDGQVVRPVGYLPLVDTDYVSSRPVAVHEDLVFAATANTVHAIDVADPASPELVYSQAVNGHVVDLRIEGDVLLVGSAIAYTSQQLTLLNVSGAYPLTPVAELRGHGDGVFGAAVHDGLLYVSQGSAGVVGYRLRSGTLTTSPPNVLPPSRAIDLTQT